MRLYGTKCHAAVLAVMCVMSVCICSGCCTAGVSASFATNPVDGIMCAAVMHDRNCGVAVGEAMRPGIPNVQFTADGGQTWNYGSNTTLVLFNMCEISDAVYIAAGADSAVVKTMDGGRTWNRCADIPSGSAKGVSFVTERNGWCWTIGALYGTADGASSWRRIKMPDTVSVIESACMTAPESGFVCSGDGQLFFTRDNGETWTASAKLFEYHAGAKSSKCGFVPIVGKHNQTTAIGVSGQSGCAAVGGTSNGKPAVLLFRTTDGGATWGDAVTLSCTAPVFAVAVNRAGSVCVLDITGVVSVFDIQ